MGSIAITKDNIPFCHIFGCESQSMTIVKQLYKMEITNDDRHKTTAITTLKKDTDLGFALTKETTDKDPVKRFKWGQLCEFMNHSDKPNTALSILTKDLQLGERSHIHTITRVRSGVELTIDYRTLPWKKKKDYVNHTYSPMGKGSRDKLVYDVVALWKLVPKKMIERKLTDLTHIMDNKMWSKKKGGPLFSPNEILLEKKGGHYEDILSADLKYPIIFDADGELIDGYHRLTKAYLNKDKTIRTNQFRKISDMDPAIIPDLVSVYTKN